MAGHLLRLLKKSALKDQKKKLDSLDFLKDIKIKRPSLSEPAWPSAFEDSLKGQFSLKRPLFF